VRRAFVVRPFGKKKDLADNEIDFDRVERELIGPALDRLGVTGRTTGEILEAGNIRADMFQRLLTADLVIADVSVHNANVFYELGIRHALRHRSTFLIRCRADQFPFDLQTDRYFEYDRDIPAAALEALVAGLRQTLDSQRQDSPVFQSLPELVPQDQGRFRVVPFDFCEEVAQAADAKEVGDLALFAAEVEGLEWEAEGLRVVGRAQVRLADFARARDTWGRVRQVEPHDKEANLVLGTVYERLGQATLANQAIERVLGRTDLEAADRAEAHALLGRNKKNQWKDGWWNLVDLSDRRDEALRSPQLQESFEAYRRAFREDRHHFYSGLNALAMLTVLVQLARGRPEVWAEGFASRADATRDLIERDRQLGRLTTGVELALETALSRQGPDGKIDPWLALSQADLACLTARPPALVATAYRRALTPAEGLHRNTAEMQLRIYEHLGLLGANVQSALQAVVAARSQGVPVAPPARVLLFTGHRIDERDQSAPRFPAARESSARSAITEQIRQEQAQAGGLCLGIAGGANGGDILFHEVCSELGIPSKLCLVMPREPYIGQAVQPAAPAWVSRFDRIWQRGPTRTLNTSVELPRWLRSKPAYGVWQRSNRWLLCNAVTYGAERVTLIALWDGRPGDGPGGTQDLVDQAQLQGIRTIILDTAKLFGLTGGP
jgi:hypothetical protein